jgi:hypothetical protein
MAFKVPNGIDSDKHFFFHSKWVFPAEPDVAQQREDGNLPRRGDELGALWASEEQTANVR